MSPPVHSFIAWFGRRLGWSNSRQSWEERLGTLGVLAAAVVLAGYGGRFPLGVQVVLWGILVAAAALLMRRGWLKLFGPILFYDLVQVGRRTRYLVLRALYATFLGVVLIWLYCWWPEMRYGAGVSNRFKMYEFTQTFFLVFMVCQLVAILILTPGYVAGAIADEKDRKTLEFLLATDLRDREIVLGKLVSRMANLLLIILTGLPVLSFVQFLGGIEPELMLAGFVVSTVTMASLAGLSILCSVHARKAREAIILTYFFVAAYLTLSFLTTALPANILTMTAGGLFRDALGSICVFVLPSGVPSVLEVSVSADGAGTEALTVQDLLAGFNAGNFFIAMGTLTRSVNTGSAVVDALPQLLRNYVVFHLVVCLVSTGIGTLRLRAVALNEAQGEPRKWLGFRHLLVLRRPRVGRNPMLWKEVFAEPGLHLHWMLRIVVALFVILSFIPVGLIVYEVMRPRPWASGNFLDQLGEGMNVYVRMVGTLVACLLWLGVAVRAAGSVSGERDKQTLDALLTSPLDASSILFSKWVGNILSVRWGWLWLGTIWLLGVLTTGVQIWAVPLLLGAWLIYAGVFSWIGLWFSLVCKTTLRATIWTLVTTLGFGIGHWVPMLFCCIIPMSYMMRGPERDLQHVAFFQFGQTPPFVLGLLAFQGREFRNMYRPDEMIEMIGFSLLGLGTWLVAGLVLGGLANVRFQSMTNREEMQRPERRYGFAPEAPLGVIVDEGPVVFDSNDAKQPAAEPHGTDTT